MADKIVCHSNLCCIHPTPLPAGPAMMPSRVDVCLLIFLKLRCSRHSCTKPSSCWLGPVGSLSWYFEVLHGLAPANSLDSFLVTAHFERLVGHGSWEEMARTAILNQLLAPRQVPKEPCKRTSPGTITPCVMRALAPESGVDVRAQWGGLSHLSSQRTACAWMPPSGAGTSLKPAQPPQLWYIPREDPEREGIWEQNPQAGRGKENTEHGQNILTLGAVHYPYLVRGGACSPPRECHSLCWGPIQTGLPGPRTFCGPFSFPGWSFFLCFCLLWAKPTSTWNCLAHLVQNTTPTSEILEYFILLLSHSSLHLLSTDSRHWALHKISFNPHHSPVICNMCVNMTAHFTCIKKRKAWSI